jgi:Tol biopolymer transport system component
MPEDPTIVSDSAVDEFERLGRAAGAELRAMAPRDGTTDVSRTVRRRQRIRGTAAAALLIVIVLGGFVVIANRNSNDVTPLRQPLPAPDTVPAATTTANEPADDTVLDGEAWIVYEASDGGRLKLMLVRPDGTGLHELVPTLAGGDQEKAFWSPDGASVVFVMPETVGSIGIGLWTVAADGSDPAQLLECRDECRSLDDPAWSPDGGSIVFARMTLDGDSTRSTLERVDVRTGVVEVLLTADPLEFYGGTRWSPDGRSLVVEVVRRASADIDADVTGVALAILDLDADQPGLRNLTDPATFGVTPDWSPTGELIVYAAPTMPGNDGTDLFAISPDGGAPTRLTYLADVGGHAAFPSFDAAGDLVYFAARAADAQDYVIASVDRSGGEPSLTLGETTVNGTHARLRP